MSSYSLSYRARTAPSPTPAEGEAPRCPRCNAILRRYADGQVGCFACGYRAYPPAKARSLRLVQPERPTPDEPPTAA